LADPDAAADRRQGRLTPSTPFAQSYNVVLCAAESTTPIPHPIASRLRPKPAAAVRRLLVDRSGTIAAATQIVSPNCDARPVGELLSLLVIHNISLPPGQFGGDAIIDLFTNRLDPHAHPDFGQLATMRVSSHFLIRRGGTLLQFVPCGLRAWHAGASSWQGRTRCNDFSIGVELEGTDELPYADAQYAMLARLTRALRRRYPISDVAGHDQIAPGRKTDPGPAFDWARYRRMVDLA
jgi:AmpD protein